VIFAYLLHRIGPEKLWETIRSVRPIHVGLALPIFFVMIWIKSIKVQCLLRRTVPPMDLYRFYAFGFSVGSITPGRIGEFSKIVFLTRAGVPLAEAVSVIVIDRLSDVGLMIALAVAGVSVFFGPVAGWIGLGVTGVILAAAMAVMASERLLKQFARGKLRELVDLEGSSIRTYIGTIPARTWASAGVWTVVYLGLYYLQMWILAKGLGLSIGYGHTAMAISAAAVPAILPISVFNVGPRDAVLAAIFSSMGWGAESGMALSTLILALFLINGAFGLFFLPRKSET